MGQPCCSDKHRADIDLELSKKATEQTAATKASLQRYFPGSMTGHGVD